jgi:DNA polymerase I-like protein with 3'-5' exonuclease and polymerase domains
MMQVLVVGESPQINPLARSILEEALDKAGLIAKHMNVLDEPLSDGKKVGKTVMKNAGPRLRNRVKAKKHPYILLMGNTPCEALLQQKGIKKLRGKPVLWEGRVVLPIYHPNIAIHDDKWIEVIENDILRLRECVDFKGIPEERGLDYIIVDDWDKVKRMVADLRGVVSIDLETSRLYPYTTAWDVQIQEGHASQELLKDHKATHGSNNMPRVVAMQFGCRKRQWVVPMETAGIWTSVALRKIVSMVSEKLPKCTTVFHNGKFDCLWMLERFGVKWTVDFDTQNAHYLLDENDFHGLKYLAQKFLGAPDWDVDGKEKTEWSPKNAKYAAHDVFYTRKLYFYLKKMLDEDHEVRQVFEEILMPCVELFIEAEHHGVYVDLDRMDDAENYLREELSTALASLKRWEKKATCAPGKKGEGFNWGSPKQLGHLLFKDLGIGIIEYTKTGAPSVSESVILRIDHPLAGDLLKFRAAQKQLSSFIEGWKPYLDTRGYLHPSFKLHGTVTGRLSCENPNLQQVPRDPRIRALITAPPGWELIEMDLSQIELRIAAELADEHNMLRVFHEGGDPHWQTALREIERGAGYKKEILKTAQLHHEKYGKDFKKMSYSEAVEYILGIGGSAAAELMDMWKEIRKKAKAINFGYLYGMWWKKFKIYARDNYGVHVTDHEAEASREAFFELYPKLEPWHTKQKRFAQVNGYVRSLSGRKRRLPAAQGGRDTPERREAQRQAINSPVQSFANELNLMAAIQMRIEFNRRWFRIIGTVHDAVLMLVRQDKVEHVYRRGLEIMSKPELLKTFEIEMGVPIEAEAKIGAWSKGTGIEKWLAAQQEKAANSNFPLKEKRRTGTR